MHFYIKNLQFLLYVILTYVSKKNNLKQKIKKQKKQFLQICNYHRYR